jgi:hypothetical protein
MIEVSRFAAKAPRLQSLSSVCVVSGCFKSKSRMMEYLYLLMWRLHVPHHKVVYFPHRSQCIRVDTYVNRRRMKITKLTDNFTRDTPRLKRLNSPFVTAVFECFFHRCFVHLEAFNTIVRPSPRHVRAIVFDIDASGPAFIWHPLVSLADTHVVSFRDGYRLEDWGLSVATLLLSAKYASFTQCQ